MTNEILSAITLLEGTSISLLDAARLVRNILDSKPQVSSFSDIEFCSKIIDSGKRIIKLKSMPVEDGFISYLESKKNLRRDSFKDIKYLGQRLIRSNPNFAAKNFSDLSAEECETSLNDEFKTPPQFNKARTMLHGLFEFAVRKQWCDKNIVKLVAKKKVIEREIKPLSISQTQQILETAQKDKFRHCLPAVAILIFAGVRPSEIKRMKCKDIDFAENSITVRSICSKTGGVRHVEICPALKSELEKCNLDPDGFICPPNWARQWKNIRDESGFKGSWTQDILRHTYASYHAKFFKDLPRLQINMGHRDTSLLRSRYVNMSGISIGDAKRFFN